MKVGIVGHAERRQVVALQRADAGRRGGGELPVHDDRAERRDRARADERLDAVAETIGARPVVHDTIDFHDIAGLVRGAHRGRGARQQVPREHPRDGRDRPRRARARRRAGHPPRGPRRPAADIETIETELIYADLEQAERRLERVAKQAKSRRQGGGRRGGVAARADRGAAGGPAGAHRAAARGRARRAARPRSR